MIFELILYLTFGVTLVYGFYKWSTINKDYFTPRNLKVVKFPFSSGNVLSLLAQRNRPKDFLDDIYYQFPDEKYVFLDADGKKKRN